MSRTWMVYVYQLISKFIQSNEVGTQDLWAITETPYVGSQCP